MDHSGFFYSSLVNINYTENDEQWYNFFIYFVTMVSNNATKRILTHLPGNIYSTGTLDIIDVTAINLLRNVNPRPSLQLWLSISVTSSPSHTIDGLRASHGRRQWECLGLICQTVIRGMSAFGELLAIHHLVLVSQRVSKICEIVHIYFYSISMEDEKYGFGWYCELVFHCLMPVLRVG